MNGIVFFLFLSWYDYLLSTVRLLISRERRHNTVVHGMKGNTGTGRMYWGGLWEGKVNKKYSKT